jgi:hypothetical protein
MTTPQERHSREQSQEILTNFNTTNFVTLVQILVSVLTQWLELGGQLQCKTSTVSGRDGHLHTQTPQWPTWEYKLTLGATSAN